MIMLSFLFYAMSCKSQEPENAQNHKAVNKAEPLIIHGIRQDFVRISNGEFLMGSDERPDEKPTHSVCVNAFDMAILGFNRMV
jgi:formylglycine-generating enzyme required for sulfatase activity